MKDDMKEHLLQVVNALKEKLYKKILEGPEADSLVITPEEATLVYRFLFESK